MATYTQRDETSSLVARHKRRGVALSCAECRRLKLKCSRVFPCSNCVKKGCSAICPDNSLTTGKGNRFVLANTEVLHEKINILSNRVRHLEDALSQSHALHSNHIHPLLTEELLQIKRPLERERTDQPSTTEDKSEPGEAIDALGSLSISNGGKASFYGPAASSWHLLQNEVTSDDEEKVLSPPEQSPMPIDVPWLSYAFPFTSAVNKTAEGVRGSIISLLPPATRARKICDIYYRHGAWMYTPISQQDFSDTVFRPVYDEGSGPETVDSHSLAILFMVLALGTFLDLEKPAHDPESIHYYQLARAALALNSVLDDQTIPAIQALLLMCHFMFLADMGGPRWVTMGIVVKLAHSIGLHRDSGKWKLDVQETQKRRELFYELLTYDSWQSLTFGRPPSLSSAHIDSTLPHPTSTTVSGEVEMSFAAWKHRFSSQCLSVVHDQAFGTRTPSYKVIQELDKKVRTWYIPPSLQVPGFGNTKMGVDVEQPSVELTMQRYITFAIKEITLFYMHRGFFAQALEDNPGDPMGSKYSQSVLAAYTSATSFIGLIESLFKQHPALTERMWFLFTHVFSCAIVLGSIAVKSGMALAPSAFSHLESAYNLFARVSDHTRTGKILPILQKLRDRALSTLSSTHQSPPSETATRLSFFGPKVKSEVDELSALGGMTRLVARRSPSSPLYSTPSPNPQNPRTPPPLKEPNSYPPLPVDNTNAWQNYTHIQNFNVNINVGDPYASTYPATTPTPQHQDMPLIYPHHQLQSQTRQQHQYHHQQGGGGVPLEVSGPEYYGYALSNGYSTSSMNQMIPSPEVTTPPHDLHDSWQNFMAQYGKQM